MADIHDRYDSVFGKGIVDALEQLQVFQIFTSTWFTVGLFVLVISIVVCTLDRTPRLWRQSVDVRVVQPEPFFLPTLPDRAAMTGVGADAVRSTLRRHRFKLREAEVDGVRYVYGDRHQYTKMATLLTHLGLILFLVAAVVTSVFGDEQGLIVTEGDSLTVQPIGTPGLLLVKNLGFEAPGFFETGQATDFTTDLAVYQDGQRDRPQDDPRQRPARRSPATRSTRTGSGRPSHLLISDARTAGRSGTDRCPSTTGGRLPIRHDVRSGSRHRPAAAPPAAGRRNAGSSSSRRIASIGEEADGTPIIEDLFPLALAAREAAPAQGTDFSVGVLGFGEYTLLIAKNDPGQGIVWTAFASLITGIAITFYLPRRRIWTRLSPAGELAIVARSDRYVDVEREFGRLLDDLVASRQPVATARPA